jgi:hypothetical protein
MQGELETADVNRGRPCRLWLELKLRDNVLNGSLIAFSQRDFYTGPLAHWVELGKKRRLGSEAGMQTRPTLAVCSHHRISHLSREKIGHLSSPKIVRLTDALGSRLCYTGGRYWTIGRFNSFSSVTRSVPSAGTAARCWVYDSCR